LINSSGPHRYTYDLAGNTTWYQRGFQDGAEDRMSYYAADGQLRAADYRQLPVQVAPATLVFEQYRYDALGRRIWVRTDRACDSTLVVYASPPAGTRCNLSTLRRTVWDGTQELWEIEVPVKLSGDAGEQPASVQDDDTYQPNLSTTTQGHDQNPFFGRVLYVHGRVVDQPLGLTRFNYVSRPVAGGAAIAFSPSTYSLFWTQQGAVTLAACASGAVVPCTKTASGRTDTLLIASPAAIYLYRRDRYAPRSFMGTLVADKADAARTVYRRNRSYDPASGRFTQEDPIGLAGGMNLYGFAGGDPANFSDPFGLCPKDQGGDGRSTALGDCPIGSSGWAEFNRRASGRVADAGFGDPVFFLSGTARLAKSGLSGASAALVSLFSTGSISGASIIGIRSTLLTGGFKMGLAENRAGYLFTHSSGEVVRIMRRGGGWDLRVQNAAGNYLDDMGSVASPAKTHSIRVLSK
jgi:RHS repeat-associated protein